MNFLIILISVTAFVVVCKSLIKKYAMVFYILALLLDILFVIGRSIAFPGIINDFVYICIQKCTLALAVFVVVMYIGIFSKGSKPRNYLMPIRKELSIMACLLTLGHIVVYLSVYASRMINDFAGMDTSIASSLVISLVLLVLLVLLGATSFDLVKKHMSAQAWKRIQRFAYPFFMLVYVHVLLFLLPPALAGGQAAQISVVVYSLVFIIYGVARIIAAIKESTASRGKAGEALKES